MTQKWYPPYERTWLEVHLSDSLEEVVISGNLEGLTALRDSLTNLIDNPGPWRHHHFDDWNGLEGNIPHLVIVVKPNDYATLPAPE